MPREQCYSFLAVAEHKRPGVTYGGPAEFERLDVRDDRIDDREAQGVGLQFEEDLCMPVRQGAVEVALAECKIQRLLLALRRSVLTVPVDAHDTRGSELHPLAQVGVGGGDVSRIDGGVVVLRSGALVVRAVDIRGMVVQVDSHGEPVERIRTDSMILGISGSDQQVNLLHGSGEVIR